MLNHDLFAKRIIGAVYNLWLDFEQDDHGCPIINSESSISQKYYLTHFQSLCSS
jgi:hypothetical protein